jgi:hypothetical protein
MDLTTHYTEFELLYIHSEKPYSPKKSWTTTKEFTPSFKRIEKEFVETPLAPLQGIEPTFKR